MSPSSSLPSCRPAWRRRALLGGLTAPLVLVGSLVMTSPALAASSTVSTKADLSSAFGTAASGDTIKLGADLTGDGGANDVLTVPASTSLTLNLAGHELDVDQIVLSSGSRLLVLGSSNANSSSDYGSAAGPAGHLLVGTASVTSSDTGPTGMEVDSGARLTLDAVNVTAAGSADRPGIGSAPGQSNGGFVAVEDSAVVTATGGQHGAGVGGGAASAPSQVQISGASVTATGGSGGAGIGGGYAATGSTYVNIYDYDTNDGQHRVVAQGGSGAAGIGGGQADPASGSSYYDQVYLWSADVSASDGGLTTGAPSGTAAPSAVGAGQDAQDNGYLYNEDSTLRIPAGATLIASSNAYTDNEGGTIEIAGVLTGDGSIDNSNGNLRVVGQGRIVADNLSITGNNYHVTLDPGTGTTTAPADVRVYANSVTAAGSPLSGYTGISGDEQLVGWSVIDPDSGQRVPLADQYLGGLVDPAGNVDAQAVYETPVVLGSASLPHAALGQAYAQTVPVTGPATGFSIGTDGSLPVGMSLDPTSGRITGTPTAPGHYVFSVTASTAYQHVTKSFTLDVAGAPVFATTVLPGALTGSAYSVPVLATSVGAAGTTRYSLVGGSLPAGLALDPASGVLSGTPTTTGTATFRVQATNDFGSAAVDLAVSVAAGRSITPVLPTIPASTVKVGHPFALSVAADSASTVTYSVPRKDLPRGLVLNTSTGLISGVPRVHGSFVLRVTATSSAGSTTQDYRVVVPAPRQEIASHVSAVTPAAGGRVKVSVSGLKAGEKWQVRLDGHRVKSGTSRFGGTVITTVRLPRATRDAVHRIQVSGGRASTDPAVLTTDTSTVTAVVAKKHLGVKHVGKHLEITGLAGLERVTVRHDGRIVAAGRADADGAFMVTVKHLGKGTWTVTGSTKQRTGRVTLG